MKGVILAGGLGTRLRPLTDVVNKHLLPVGSKPMLFWPLEFLVRNGINDIMIVVGGQSTGDILHQIGNGSRFGAKVVYANQEDNSGIVGALKLAETFIGDDKTFAVVLGDNIYFDIPLPEFNGDGAMLFLTHSDTPELFGTAHVENGRITKIVEKPERPDSDLVVTGLYLYDSTAWERIRALTPSGRGEYEVTDLNNSYIRDGKCAYHILKGLWIDAGTPRLYHQANRWAMNYEGML